jgi:hypothetical protein
MPELRPQWSHCNQKRRYVRSLDGQNTRRIGAIAKSHSIGTTIALSGRRNQRLHSKARRDLHVSSAARQQTSQQSHSRRRSAINWVDHPSLSPTRQLDRSRRSPGRAAIRQTQALPEQPGLASGTGERCLSVRATWSDAERESRRLNALRKQDELLMLIAGDELEDSFRLAVADGELPLAPPEFEGRQF